MSLSFTSNGDTTVKLIQIGSPDPIALKYSTDKLDWFDYQIGVEIPLSTNSSLYLSGNNDHFSKNIQNRYQFVTSGEGELTVKGDIRDLSRIEDFAFNSLFSGCANIVDANGLKIIDDANLPSSKARKWTFANMFIDCINLRTPPSSFTNVKPGMWCFSSTFGNCISLTAVPLIGTTHYSPYSHYCMFYNCKSLSSAPRLTAFHLADWCYNSMFYGCTSLTSISADFISWTPSTATTNWVTGIETEGQFYNDNVDYIYGVDNVPESWKVNPQKALIFRAISGNPTVSCGASDLSCNLNNHGWKVYENTTFTLSAGQEVAFKGNKDYMGGWDNKFSTGGDGTLEVYGTPNALMNNFNQNSTNGYTLLFAGCSNIVDASRMKLPTMDLPSAGYMQMFSGCTALTAAPDLPATGLAGNCYYKMFEECHSLSTAPQLPATTLAEYCYLGMFYHCWSLNKMPELPADNLELFCYQSMFDGCDSLTGTIVLSASNIATGSYHGMFAGCDGITDVIISATKINYGYSLQSMFYYCSNLSSITVNFTQWTLDTGSWVVHVAANGVFTKPTDLPEEYGYNNIPSGWTVINT